MLRRDLIVTAAAGTFGTACMSMAWYFQPPVVPVIWTALAAWTWIAVLVAWK